MDTFLQDAGQALDLTDGIRAHLWWMVLARVRVQTALVQLLY
jgi:hypothetical protein